MEFQIKNIQLPSITTNFEELKNGLTQTLNKYKGLIVTEDTLSDCKATQKELAGHRIKIDNFRKEKKKELSKPIEEFENQCKELIKLVEDAEKPIKEGIQVFDDKKREEKRFIAQRICQDIAEEFQLLPKYASQLNVLDKYTNLTAKESEVREDVKTRAFILKEQQIKEQELLEIIQDAIDRENQTIKTPLHMNDFQRLIDRGMATKEVLQEISLRAEMIREAEKPKAVEEVKEEPKAEPVQEIVQAPNEKEEIYFVDLELRIVGSKEMIEGFCKNLKEKGIKYTAVNKGVVE